MDQRTLFYFTTLIDQGSFTKAAKSLHISQPSLSSAIKKLEITVGLKLIERTTRKIALTKEGEALYKEAKKLLHHFDFIKTEMNRLKHQGPLKIQIGVIESIKAWLPKVISIYKHSHPDIHIKLSEVLGLYQVEKGLQNYEIHLAITNQYFENEEIVTIPIYKEDLVALLPKEHPLEKVQQLSITDIQQDKLIISEEGFQTREDILREFQKRGITPNIHFEIERFETACSLVEEGLGITIVPENYIKHLQHPSFSIKPIDSDNLSRSVYIAYMKHRYLPPVVEEFIDITRNYFK